jgi:hypothetical protein
MDKIVEKNWDYSKNAAFYQYRPNYSVKAIRMLMNYVRSPGGGQEHPFSSRYRCWNRKPNDSLA